MVLWLLHAFAVLAAAVPALVYATPLPESSGRLYRRQGLAQVISSCTVPNTIALTFDDGPFWYLRVRIHLDLLPMIRITHLCPRISPMH